MDLKNRTKLETVIPLDTPFVVFVDPSDACNFKCRFCPTSDRELMKKVGRPWKQMPLELFKKIADDMTKFPNKIEVLRLYKDGEPLINKDFPAMIKYAKDIKASNRIDTTTNASLLTKKRAEEIVKAGLDRINIAIYGIKSEHYSAFSGVKLEFKQILENVRNFYEIRGQCEMLVKINGDQLTEEEKNVFLEYFGDYTDKIYIEHTMSCWPEFNLRGVDVTPKVGIYGQQIKEVEACPYPFYSIAINSDGLVSVCFLDWGRKLGLGNIREESLKDVWEGKAMKQYRKMFLEGERKNHPVCGNCGQMSHGNPDNIDPFKKEILEKLNNMGYFENN